MKISGWGKYPLKDTEVLNPKNLEELKKIIKLGKIVARGNGRSYGDSSVGLLRTINMKNFNNIISFDQKNGVLTAEAGVLLKDIINKILPNGWFPFVTPGTKFVTLGGLIAADVHGKNHHKDGNFSNYVEWFDLINSKGEILRCSKDENTEIFEWTLGGMGLTGIIIKAAIRLRPIKTAWIKQKIITTKNLDETIDLFEKNESSTYSVAWIDCLEKKKNFIGRSVLILGEHAKIDDLDTKKKAKPFDTPNKINLTVPLNFPSWFLNAWFVKIFNSLYYWKNKQDNKIKLIDWNSYFYPLDKLLEWNKIYGKKGFAQFQCVIPINNSRKGINELLKAVRESEVGSFLSVLKKLGPEKGKFSFPLNGFTLALDFPINEKTLILMEKLDKITSKYNGRIYLAKDSRMSRETLEKTEKRLKDFYNFRKNNQNVKTFASSQSIRLGL